MFFGNNNTQIKEFLAKGATIVDVRSPMEYEGGHVEGSINIPLNTIPSHVDNFKEEGKALITCCASGARSGQAAQFLEQNGIEVANGGPWGAVREAVMANV